MLRAVPGSGGPLTAEFEIGYIGTDGAEARAILINSAEARFEFAKNNLLVAAWNLPPSTSTKSGNRTSHYLSLGHRNRRWPNFFDFRRQLLAKLRPWPLTWTKSQPPLLPSTR